MYKKTTEYVEEYALDGLRTLFLAEKYLDEEVFQNWLQEKEEAKLAVVDREEKLAAVDEKIETDLELIGSTAIEDQL